MWPLQYYDSNRAFQSVGAILPSCWRLRRQRGFFCMLCVFLLGKAEQKHTQHAFSFVRERSSRGWDGSIAPTDLILQFAACGGGQKEGKGVFRGYPEPQQGRCAPC